MTDWPLLPGETVLWEGRPSGTLSLRPVRPITDQLALVWGVIGIATLVGFAAMDIPGAGLVVPGTLAFIGVQLWIVAATNAARRRRSRYAVTDRRALIALDGVGVRALRPLDPGAIRLESGPPDCVVIGRAPLTFRMEAGGTQTTWREHRFEMIEDGARVAGLLRAAAERNGADRPEGWTWSVLPEPPGA